MAEFGEEGCRAGGRAGEKRGQGDSVAVEERQPLTKKSNVFSGAVEADVAEGGSNDQQQDTRSQVMAPEAAADMPPGEDMPPAEDMQTAFRRMSEETKEFYAKWMNPFSESGEFESFCHVRLDELLKEAYSLEESLKQQKERLKERLRHLSQTLDMMSRTT